TFQWNNSKNDKRASTSITLLSYNVRVFNNYNHLSEGGKAAKNIISFSEKYKADIKCFQEFYHQKQIPEKTNPLYNTIQKLRKLTPYYYLEPTAIIEGQYFGLAIFSKY